MSGRSYRNGAPTVYAAEKLPLLRPRLAGDLGAFLRRMVPIAFPGADVEGMVFALIGFTSFSTGWTENTTDGVALQAFHEVGLYQTPAGPRGGPAPNADPRAANNAYGKLAGGELVRSLLGRAASTSPNAWKPTGRDADRDRRAKEEQTAVGLANLRGDEAVLRSSMERAAPGSAGSLSGWSVWRVFCMFTAFSRGPGGAYLRLQPYLARLARHPEASRLRYLCTLVDTDLREGSTGIGTRAGKSGTPYGIARSMQKLASGRKLAESTPNGPVQFFADVAIDPGVEDRITRVAYSVSLVGAAADAASAVAGAASALVETATATPATKAVTALVAVAATVGAVALARS